MGKDMLSPTSINLFLECRRCFWLKTNEGIKRPSFPFPSLPGGMDRIIKEHFDRYRGSGEVPPELEESDVEAVPHPDERFLENCRDWRSEPAYHDGDLEVVVRGAVDDLLKTREGEIIVLDYKTRGYPPKEDTTGYYVPQVNLYNLILRSNGYETADFGLILYYYPEKVLEEGDVVFHSEFDTVEVDLEGAKEMVEKAVETMRGPMPGHSSDCDFCDWNAMEHPS